MGEAESLAVSGVESFFQHAAGGEPSFDPASLDPTGIGNALQASRKPMCEAQLISTIVPADPMTTIQTTVFAIDQSNNLLANSGWAWTKVPWTDNVHDSLSGERPDDADCRRYDGESFGHEHPDGDWPLPHRAQGDGGRRVRGDLVPEPERAARPDCEVGAGKREPGAFGGGRPIRYEYVQPDRDSSVVLRRFGVLWIHQAAGADARAAYDFFFRSVSKIAEATSLPLVSASP